MKNLHFCLNCRHEFKGVYCPSCDEANYIVDIYTIAEKEMELGRTLTLEELLEA